MALGFARALGDFGATLMVAGNIPGRTQTLPITLHDIVVADPAGRVHVRTQDRQIGMVFQHAALLPHRSPLDNVALAVRSGDLSRRAPRAHPVNSSDPNVTRIGDQGVH